MRTEAHRAGGPLLAAIAALALAGCGSGSGTSANARAAVRVALTAPVEGSELNVSRVRVFGTVQPATAHVAVAGSPAHVTHGAFARWVPLRAGTSRISVVATARGYAPTRLRVRVHNAPRHSKPPSESASEAEAVPVSAAGLAPGGSSQQRTVYAAATRMNFMRACTLAGGGAATSGCECALRYVEQHLSERELANDERALAKGEAKLPRAAVEAEEACRSGAGR